MSGMLGFMEDVVTHIPVVGNIFNALGSNDAGSSGSSVANGTGPASVSPPPSPYATDGSTAAQAQAAKTAAGLEDAAAQERKIRGRAATLLTGSAGLLNTPTVSRRTLLGS